MIIFFYHSTGEEDNEIKRIQKGYEGNAKEECGWMGINIELIYLIVSLKNINLIYLSKSYIIYFHVIYSFI